MSITVGVAAACGCGRRRGLHGVTAGPVWLGHGFCRLSALAASVLIDATVVRLLLVPAVMTLLGKSAWRAPRWVDRLLPNVGVDADADADAEGEGESEQAEPVRSRG